MQFEIRFRRTHKKPIAVEIECAADADYGVKLREALGQALEANADLTGADLKGINLRDALLRGDLRQRSRATITHPWRGERRLVPDGR